MQDIERQATISDCGAYRYRLSRRWAPGPLMNWLMLNPSIADHLVDDPTIRRCMGFARREGMAGIEVFNLFALRATNPHELFGHGDPVGPDNSSTLDTVVGPVYAGWGNSLPPKYSQWVAEVVRRFAGRMWCLGTTKSGHPKHPLYIRADQAFEPFEI